MELELSFPCLQSNKLRRGDIIFPQPQTPVFSLPPHTLLPKFTSERIEIEPGAWEEG
jgi:hypothetical protein